MHSCTEVSDGGGGGGWRVECWASGLGDMGGVSGAAVEQAHMHTHKGLCHSWCASLVKDTGGDADSAHATAALPGIWPQVGGRVV